MLCDICKGKCCKSNLLVILKPFVDSHISEELTELKWYNGGFRAFMKKKDGRCIALTIDDKCSIHEIKPQVCKNFEVGSKRCLKIFWNNE